MKGAAEVEVVIRPRPGWRAVDLRELWHSRDLLRVMAIRDIKLRYRQTALGAVWVVLQPLLAAGIFSFVFGRVAKLPSGGIPYFAFAYAGLLGWNIFSSTISKASSSLVANGGLLSKIYFPRLILPLSTVSGTLLDFAVALAAMTYLIVSYHTFRGFAVLALPFWVLLALMLAGGIGLIAAAVQVSYRDVGQIVPVFMQLVLYASPVAYSVDAVPSHLRTLYTLNPVVGMLEGFRWSLVGGGPIRLWAVVYSTVFGAVLLVFGALSFTRMERKFTDVI
ncbi:MAG: lipopolysaccharide transport system permease protein [Acidimicrobiaceae bacterium]